MTDPLVSPGVDLPAVRREVEALLKRVGEYPVEGWANDAIDVVRELLSAVQQLEQEKEQLTAALAAKAKQLGEEIDCRVANQDSVRRLIAERDAAAQARDALRDAVLWALGENGEFPFEPAPLRVGSMQVRRRYWWRKELRERCGSALDAVLAPQGTP